MGRVLARVTRVTRVTKVMVRATVPRGVTKAMGREAGTAAREAGTAATGALTVAVLEAKAKILGARGRVLERAGRLSTTLTGAMAARAHSRLPGQQRQL